MAELHVIGQIVSGKQVDSLSNLGLFCKWTIHCGSAWKRIGGAKEGQTQVDTPVQSDVSYWSHPLDFYYFTSGLQGWPKVVLEVYRQDGFGRSDLCGYGVAHVPATPGVHKIEVPIWRPAGGVKDKVSRFFLGGSPELTDISLITNSYERFRLKTTPTGIVTLELGVIHRNFDKFGVETY